MLGETTDAVNRPQIEPGRRPICSRAAPLGIAVTRGRTRLGRSSDGLIRWRGLETGLRQTYTGTKLETADTANGSLWGIAPVVDPTTFRTG
jgi:hypothetical protein